MAYVDPQRWSAVRDLFDRAAALPVAEREDFLSRECADDAMRQEVRSLLDYESGGLETLAGEIAEESAALRQEADQRLIGARLGPYKVEAIAGYGGMGAVYRASRDDAEFHQQVAIKLVRAAMQSADTHQRFKQERQILARLAHPNIARLLDGGSTSDGVPYLVMEFIEGKSITEWTRQEPAIEPRLRLFLQVCDGVRFAHERLVVHRDLKPGNILVTADGAAKLLDFGIAKLLDSEPGADGASTLGNQAMTPEYAPPEQVRGEPVSQAADIYALGLILYEMLTGEKAQSIPDPSPDKVTRIVCHMEPVPPAQLRPALAGDLDNIIRMAIRKEPERRYRSVAEFAQDIRRHLEGRPVKARPDTLAYRASKFVRRNRAAVSVSLFAAVMFAAAGAAYRIRAPERLPHVLRVTQITHNGRVAGNGLATDGAYVYCVLRAPGEYKLARVPVTGGVPQPMEPALHIVEILDLSPDRTSLLVSNGLGEDVPLWIVPVSGGAARRAGEIEAHAAVWGPDGKRIVYAKGQDLFAVDGQGGAPRKIQSLPGSAVDLQRSPNPETGLRFLVPASGVALKIWDMKWDGAGLHTMFPDHANGPHFAGEYLGRWLADGKYYVFVSASKETNLWAIREDRRLMGWGERRPEIIYSSPSYLNWISPAPDGKRLYVAGGSERREFVRFDRARGEFVPYLPGVTGRWASFSRDGKRLAYTVAPQETLWLSNPDGSEARQLDTSGVKAIEPAWAPSGDWIVFTGLPEAGQADSLYALPVGGGRLERLTEGDFSDAHASFSPDGRTLLFKRYPLREQGANGLYLMDWKTRRISFLEESRDSVGAWSPDGRYIVAHDRVDVRLYDTRTQRWTTLGQGAGFGEPFWSRNGKYIFFQNQFEAEQPIWRVPANGGRFERLTSSRQIPQSDLTNYMMAGLAPDDTPIAAVIRKNADIYALDLDLP